MRVIIGTTNVAAAGTRVQISNTPDRVKSIAVRGRLANVGNVFFGTVTVSSTVCWTLEQGASTTLDFGDGSVLFSTFYVDAVNNNDKLDYMAIVE